MTEKKNKNLLSIILKVFKVIVYILLSIIILASLYLIIQSKVSTDKTPSIFGYKAYVIMSGSMEPTIKIGDIVISKTVNKEDIGKDDIISFRDGRSVVTHRIVENHYTSYKTQGDNNNAPDKNEVLYENVEGKVVSVIPQLGSFFLALQDKLAFIIIIIFFIMIFIKDRWCDDGENK